MKNREYYKDILYELFENEINEVISEFMGVLNGEICRCEGGEMDCEACKFNKGECVSLAKYWLGEEYEE